MPTSPRAPSTPARARSITIADVLRLPVIVAGQPEVVAGQPNLARPVRWVHVTELLDPASFLEGGELILTTGMPHPEDPVLLRAYVDQLADVGAAGLVIELGRRYQRVPGDLVRACQNRDLPLIVLNRGVRFIDVTQTVHALILDAQGDLLRRAQRVHDTFSALTLRCAEPDEILRAAAELTGCPVVLENLVHHAVSCSPAGRLIGQVLLAWPRRSQATPTPDCASSSGPENWLVAPLENHGDRWGRLIMVPDENDPVIGPEHIMVLEHATTALALRRLSGNARWDRAAHETTLRDLIERRYRTPTEARTRAESLGLPVTGHRLITLLIRSGRSSSAREGFDDRLASQLAASGLRALVGEVRPGITGVLIALARASAWQPVAERIGRAARDDLGPDTIVAVGTGVADLGQVARSYAEAERIMEAIRPGSSDRPFHVASDIGLPQLLHALRDDVRVQQYVNRQLGRLVEHDERHGGDLVATLQHYLTEAGNKSAAAKRSGLSRQSFYLRLRTIERLLGCDLESGEQRTQLHVAIIALDALNSAPDPLPASSAAQWASASQ